MTVVVEPLVGRTISNLISLTCGPMLSVREADILDYCQRLGEVYAGFVDGELVCCWGLIPPSFVSTKAYLWMWHSQALAEHQFLFIRHSQRQIETMLERYEAIIGDCVAGGKAVRWLKWLGAEFSRGENGRLSFVIRKH